MIDVSSWMNTFLEALRGEFGERVWFVGLQGSYARGEATKSSDIDVVVILDELSVADINAYHAVIQNLPYRDLICGFVSGKDELLCWEPSDLFQFYYDTKPIFGTLDDILPLLDGDAVSRAIKSSVCNIYHICVHNMLHEKSEDILRSLYKSASFVIQAISFKEYGRYISRQGELLEILSSEEKAILNTFINLKNGGAVDFQAMSEGLFTWSAKQIKKQL